MQDCSLPAWSSLKSQWLRKKSPRLFQRRCWLAWAELKLPPLQQRPDDKLRGTSRMWLEFQGFLVATTFYWSSLGGPLPILRWGSMEARKSTCWGSDCSFYIIIINAIRFGKLRRIILKWSHSSHWTTPRPSKTKTLSWCGASLLRLLSKCRCKWGTWRASCHSCSPRTTPCAAKLRASTAVCPRLTLQWTVPSLPTSATRSVHSDESSKSAWKRGTQLSRRYWYWSRLAHIIRTKMKRRPKNLRMRCSLSDNLLQRRTT